MQTLIEQRTGHRRPDAANGTLWFQKIKGAEGKTLYFNVIHDWNRLPEKLNCENIASFKKGVKRHLMATEQADRDGLFF